MDFPSPYCRNYKIQNSQKALIMQHLIVRKLTRREIEDKYLRLIDENYDLKQENNLQREKIKILTTKLLRASKFKSRDSLFLNENSDIHEPEEIFHRPMSSSVLRDCSQNFASSSSLKYKRDILQENINADILSSSTRVEEVVNNNNEKSVDTTLYQIKEMEDEIKNLYVELKKLQESSKCERKTNAYLEIQISELRQSLVEKSMQQKLEEKIEAVDLNNKLSQVQAKLSACELENFALRQELETKSDFEDSKKRTDDFVEELEMLKKEKLNLLEQLSTKEETASAEISNYKKKIVDLNLFLDIKEKEIEEKNAEKESIAHSQLELLKKMKNLQEENDNLVVKLEGLKAENELLIDKNNKLESRIKILENQNVQQLLEINESLDFASAPVDNGQSHTTNHRITSPGLTVPIFDYEKRPSTPEKSLKQAPNIIETNQAGNDHTKPKIAEDYSPAFCEVKDTFSKDFESADDDFDPKTFSIDQVSDVDGISELAEDLDEYENLFHDI